MDEKQEEMTIGTLSEADKKILRHIASSPDETWWVKNRNHPVLVILSIGKYIERVFRRKPYGYGYKITELGLQAIAEPKEGASR